jgi:hypothetical protein
MHDMISFFWGGQGLFDAQLDFVKKIEEHLVTDFSVLELIMEYDYGMRSAGHVFGRFVFHLLGSHRIRTATQRLQILLLRSKVIPCSVYTSQTYMYGTCSMNKTRFIPVIRSELWTIDKYILVILIFF